MNRMSKIVKAFRELSDTHQDNIRLARSLDEMTKMLDSAFVVISAFWAFVGLLSVRINDEVVSAAMEDAELVTSVKTKMMVEQIELSSILTLSSTWHGRIVINLRLLRTFLKNLAHLDELLEEAITTNEQLYEYANRKLNVVKVVASRTARVRSFHEKLTSGGTGSDDLPRIIHETAEAVISTLCDYVKEQTGEFDYENFGFIVVTPKELMDMGLSQKCAMALLQRFGDIKDKAVYDELRDAIKNRTVVEFARKHMGEV